MPRGDAYARQTRGTTFGGKDTAFAMAVRHDVENLTRRGNIFYWRPRIPSALIHCGPGSRLSPSLHRSEHRKAQIIGRKLNTRLAELKTNSKDMMTTRQQLQKLFEHVLGGQVSGG